MISVFTQSCAEPLSKFFRDEYRNNHREIYVFGEFYGANSFAGRHDESDNYQIKIFDILVGHKNRKLIKPQDFVKTIAKIVDTPDVVYSGNLNDQFIKDVREGRYDVNEGVICKGTEPTGAAFGGIWQCKIKTQKYLNKLQEVYGTEWAKYWE